MNLRTAINKITMAGLENSRVICEDGSHKIEVKLGGVWTSVIAGLSQAAANRIFNDAHNRTILG